MRRRRCLNKPKRTPTNGKYQAKEPQSQITQEFQTRCVHTFLFVLPRPVGVQCGVWCGYFMWRYNNIRHVYMFFFFHFISFSSRLRYVYIQFYGGWLEINVHVCVHSVDQNQNAVRLGGYTNWSKELVVLISIIDLLN